MSELVNLDLASLLVTLKTGGPLALGAYLIVAATKRWIPAKVRALAATSLGLVTAVAYNVVTTDASLVQLVLAALGGGYAGIGAVGIHEIISKANRK